MSQLSLRSTGAGCGILAAFLNIIGFIWYGFALFSGDVDTNLVTWALWLLETSVSLILYAHHTKDVRKWAIEAVSLVGILAILILLAIKIAREGLSVVLAPVEPVDLIAAAIVVAALGFWFRNRHRASSTAPALWIFQAALVITVVPLVRSTLADPGAEPFWPWMIWTVAFGLQVLCVWLRRLNVTEFLNPVNYFLTHAVITGIVWYHTMM